MTNSSSNSSKWHGWCSHPSCDNICWCMQLDEGTSSSTSSPKFIEGEYMAEQLIPRSIREEVRERWSLRSLDVCRSFQNQEAWCQVERASTAYRWWVVLGRWLRMWIHEVPQGDQLNVGKTQYSESALRIFSPVNGVSMTRMLWKAGWMHVAHCMDDQIRWVNRR